MASWNHRVMRLPSGTDEEFLGIHEVYYDDEGKPNGYTKHAVSVSGTEGIEGLRWQLDHMIKALGKPILTPEDFKSEG